MPNFQAITRQSHAAKWWHSPSHFGFAAKDTVASLAASELAQAAVAMPITLVAQGDSYLPMAVLGLIPNKNLYVHPDGRWLGGYLPIVFKAYPFRLGQTPEGETLLCVDEDSELVNDDLHGNLFFNEQNLPPPALQEIINLLQQSEQGNLGLALACATLQEYGLIRPWPVTVKTDTGEQKVEGMFQINETALNQLSPEALAKIRDTGGLLLAYCQLLSMQHIQKFGRMNWELDQAALALQERSFHPVQPPTLTTNLDLDSVFKSDTFILGGL